MASSAGDRHAPATAGSRQFVARVLRRLRPGRLARGPVHRAWRRHVPLSRAPRLREVMTAGSRPLPVRPLRWFRRSGDARDLGGRGGRQMPDPQAGLDVLGRSVVGRHRRHPTAARASSDEGAGLLPDSSTRGEPKASTGAAGHAAWPPVSRPLVRDRPPGRRRLAPRVSARPQTGRSAPTGVTVSSPRPHRSTPRPRSTPEQRFNTVMAAAATPAAVPLPSRFATLARSIAGRIPRYRTGHRVRSALRAAGARAATVDGTLHLPAPPDDAPGTLGVVAHELSHVAEGTPPGRPAAPAGPAGHGRPRFFLRSLSSVADAGERHARHIGDVVRDRASQTLPDVPSFPAVPPVPAVPARPSVRDLPALPSFAAPPLPSPSLVPGLPSLPASPSLPRPPGLGDIASLPVGGPAAALGAARQAVDDVTGQVGGLRDMVTDRVGATLGSAGDTASSAIDAVGDRLPDPDAVLGDAHAAAQRGVGAAAADATDAVSSGVDAATTLAATAAGDLESRVGALLEALEERMLAELERRGGRYAGVF